MHSMIAIYCVPVRGVAITDAGDLATQTGFWIQTMIGNVGVRALFLSIVPRLLLSLNSPRDMHGRSCVELLAAQRKH
jgi:hypothetical protein